MTSEPQDVNRAKHALGISNLADGRLDLSAVEHLSEADFLRWTRRVTPQPNDVVFSYETRLGEAALIPEGLKCCLGRRMALLRPNRQRVIPRFLLYAFLGPQFQDTLRARTIHGSTVDRLPLNEFDSFPIEVPSLEEQQRIAEILGSLDDKIEVNRRMNETLEAMARAIFKSWFVDFDPVRAKAEGRQPAGMDAATAALFPSAFEDSSLGKIPKGWKCGKLDEFVTILSGGTPKTSVPEYWGGDIPWFSVADAPQSSDVFVIRTERTITQAGIDNSAAQILPKGTTVISARGTVGKLALLGVSMAMNQSCYGIRGQWGDYFTYYLVSRSVSELAQSTHGTVFNTITRDTFRVVDFVLPPEPLVRSFEQHVDPVMKKILANLF